MTPTTLYILNFVVFAIAGAAVFWLGWWLHGRTRARDAAAELLLRCELGARHIGAPVMTDATHGFFATPYFKEHVSHLESPVFAECRRIDGLPRGVRMVSTGLPAPTMGIVVGEWAYLVELGDVRRGLALWAKQELPQSLAPAARRAVHDVG